MNAPTPDSKRRPAAFTLIELLVVMAVIGILAALLFPLVAGVKKAQKLKVARAELTMVQAAIQSYQSKRGHFPPDNPGNPAVNQLYFELSGTVLKTVNGQPTFVTLDSSARIAAIDLNAVFGPNVTGFMNFPKSGGGDDSFVPIAFLHELRPGQIGQMAVGAQTGNMLLVCSVRGSDDPAQQVVPITGNPRATEAGLNPWRYVSSNPTHNPTTYDLWVDIPIGGKTYRVSNWRNDPEVF